MSRRVYQGHAASPGKVRGILRRDTRSRDRNRPAATSIVGAIAATLAELETLQASVGQLGSEILQFQRAMLEDDSFVLELLECGQGGVAPAAAVAAVFDTHMAELARADDETFAARAFDLGDLRDRLLDIFQGVSMRETEVENGTILFAEDLTPSRFLELDRRRVVGLVTEAGSSASHVAMLARSEAIPMVMGVALPSSCDKYPVLLDGFSGAVVVDPDPSEIAATPAMQPHPPIDPADLQGPTMLANGERVCIYTSVNSLAALNEMRADFFDGLGLVRTELLLPGPAALHQVEAQRALYAPFFTWAEGRPVTLRLFDAGGDKPIEDFTLANETNPFLGTRGARLLARRPDVLRVQLEAILRAADGRPLRILVPMVALPREITWFREQLDLAATALRYDMTAVRLGMMVETPAAALGIEAFDADFYTLGTSDLIQFTLAAARDSDIFNRNEPIAPVVLDMIRKVVAHGKTHGRDVALCGDGAGSPSHFRQFLDCGVRSFVVPGRLVSYFKHFLRTGESQLEASRREENRVRQGREFQKGPSEGWLKP